jgi:hypothetical protein
MKSKVNEHGVKAEYSQNSTLVPHLWPRDPTRGLLYEAERIVLDRRRTFGAV